MTRRAVPIFLLALILVCPGSLQANPTAPQVVSGAAAFAQPDPQTLQITNSANAIINWGQFSIQASEITRFIQPSEASAVLNRVVGNDPSAIMGQLLSNGHVFLINPNGMVFGPDAIIDTAGFTASTLNITDENFLAGRLEFTGGDAAGEIVNQGFVSAGKNGDILLIAPNIVNSGILHTDGGNLILAAGKALTITSMDAKGLHFEIQAPEDSVVNLGKILAENGAAGIFAGTLQNEGEIRADSLSLDETGAIVLQAQGDINLGQSSLITADGPAGGSIHIESAEGTTYNSGLISATGAEAEGGEIHLLGERVGLIDGAIVDASGWLGGGEILVGGGFKGKDPAIANASATEVTSGVALLADAIHDGDGGRVAVWADGVTNFYGDISARGGEIGGDGGFVEVSGKQSLTYAGVTDARAPHGALGTLLLDPEETSITIVGGSGSPQAGVIYEQDIEGTMSDLVIEAGSSITVSNSVPFGGDDIGGYGGLSLVTVAGTGIDLKGSSIGADLLIHRQDYNASPADVSITAGGTGSITLCRIETDDGNISINAGGDLIFGEVSSDYPMTTPDSQIYSYSGNVSLSSASGKVQGNSNDSIFDAYLGSGTLNIYSATGIGDYNGGAFQVYGNGDIAFNNSASGDVWIYSDHNSNVAGSNANGNVLLDLGNNESESSPTSISDITAGGDFVLRADPSPSGFDGVDIQGTIHVGTNTVYIGPLSDDPVLGFTYMSIGYGGFGDLNISQAELELINASTVTIGMTPSGGTTPYLSVAGYDEFFSSAPVNAPQQDLDLWGETVSISGGGLTFNQNLRMVADEMIIEAPLVSENDGRVILFPYSQDYDIFIGDTNGYGGLSLQPDAISKIVADWLWFGSPDWLSNGSGRDVYVQVSLDSNDISVNQLIFCGNEIFLNSDLDFSADGENLGLLADVATTIDGCTIDTGTGGIYAPAAASGLTFSGVPYETGGTGVVKTVNSPSLSGSTFQAGTFGLDSASGTVHLSAPTTVTYLDISGGGLVLDATATAENLNMSGGSLYGTGSLTLNEHSVWSGGTIGIDVTNNGAIDFEFAETGQLYATLDSVTTFTNNGTVNWISGDLEFAADSGYGGYCEIRNESGAFFDINGDFSAYRAYAASGTLDFVNAGTLQKTGGSGMASLQSLLSNTGLIDVSSGTLVIDYEPLLDGSDNAIPFTNAGTIQVTGGSMFEVAYPWDATILTGIGFVNEGTLKGLGTIRTIQESDGDLPLSLLNQGTIAPGDSIGTIESIGSLTIDGGLILGSGSVLEVEIGLLYQEGDLEPYYEPVSDLLLVNGTLYGDAGDLGRLRVKAASGYAGREGDEFEILSAWNVDDPLASFSRINQPAGFNVDASYYSGDGFYVLLTASGPIVIPEPEPFNRWILGADGLWGVASNWSYGTVPADGEEVQIVDGVSTVTLAGGTYVIGSISVAQGSALSITGGGLTISDAATISSLSITGGAATINGSASIENLNVAGGTMSIPGAATIGSLAYIGGLLQVDGAATVSGVFDWSPAAASKITGSGTGELNLEGTALFSGQGAKSLDGITVRNTGDLIYSDGTLEVGGSQAAVINNTGLFDIQGDLDINQGGGGTFVNAGTLQKSDGSGDAVITLPLSNSGTVKVDSGSLTLSGPSTSSGDYNILPGAMLLLAGDSNHTITGAEGAVTGAGILGISEGASLILSNDGMLSAVVDNAGTMTKSGATGISTFGAPVSNSGTVVAASGTMAFTEGFTQSAGLTRLSGGDISGDLTINGGVLTGNGTVYGSVDNVAGLVSPGASPGILTISGNYSQGSSGTLLVEVGGYTPGVDYDLLNVLGTVTLDGKLEVAQYGEFVSNVGDPFKFMTYQSAAGNFAVLAADSGYVYGGYPGLTGYEIITTMSPSWVAPLFPEEGSETGGLINTPVSQVLTLLNQAETGMNFLTGWTGQIPGSLFGGLLFFEESQYGQDEFQRARCFCQ